MRPSSRVLQGGLAVGLLLLGASQIVMAGRDETVAPAQLTVEHRDRPLGIDVAEPRFAWQTMAPAARRNVIQTAYRILVREPDGATIWDSGRVAESRSTEIRYQGRELHAATRYSWVVSAWYADGLHASAESWFETGLMNPDPALAAWEGARWIGGDDSDRVLYSQYFPLFDLSFSVEILPGSTHAGIVFAANDARLMDRNRNPSGLHNARDASYFKVELDVSNVNVNAAATAKLKVYRAGYAAGDDPRKPIREYRIKPSLINASNVRDRHRLHVHAEFGDLTFRINDSDDPFVTEDGANGAGASAAAAPVAAVKLRLNPMLSPETAAHDALTFGMLADIGFTVDAGQKARFTALRVSNTRKPGNTVFAEDLAIAPYQGIFATAAADRASGLRVIAGSYVLDGGQRGAFVVGDPSHGSMPLLRTSFTTAQGSIRAARIYVTARGIYELHLNGSRVGNDWYNPGLSQYNRTQYYQTFDVTQAIKPGPNALGAVLGEGWWSGLLSYGSNWNHFGDRQSLLLKLVIQYADGRRQVVTSNASDWQFYGRGPIVYSSLYMGEVYDAAREAAVAGWSTPTYDSGNWKPATQVAAEQGTYTDEALDYRRQQLVGQQDEPAREYQRIHARSLSEVRKGVYVYDLGQNIVGVPRVELSMARPGQQIILRVAEMLYPDLPASGHNVGMVMTENYRAALSQDVYLAKAGSQVIQPRFTAHGFRYLEVTGIEAPLPLAAVGALAISSVQKVTAEFTSSDPDLNQLWSNIVWSNVGNFLSIPTDCPQRNERMGWSGDLSVFSRTATYLSDADAFLQRHMRAMRDTQPASGKFTDIAPVGGGFGGVLWGSAGVTVPWELYLQYGDEAVLRDHYASMVAYLNYLESTIDSTTGLMHDVQLGDWLGPQNLRLGQQYLAVAYHIYDLTIMSRVARLLGHVTDAERFAAELGKRRDYFNARFVDAQGGTMGYVTGSPIAFGPTALAGQWKPADTQSSYAVGLGLDAFAQDKVAAARLRLAASVAREDVDDAGQRRPANSLMTGFIGTAWISQALSDAGRTDLAYRQLLNREYPSWLYAVKQGATTIWERLNGYTSAEGFGGNNSMNSFNHYSFGAVGQWLLGHSIGIQRDAPGFKRFILHPEPDPTGQLQWASGHYESPYGIIRSGWRRAKAETNYDFQVPPNSAATLYLPASSRDSVREAGKRVRNQPGIAWLGAEGQYMKYELKSGRYHFTVRHQTE